MKKLRIWKFSSQKPRIRERDTVLRIKAENGKLLRRRT